MEETEFVRITAEYDRLVDEGTTAELERYCLLNFKELVAELKSRYRGDEYALEQTFGGCE